MSMAVCPICEKLFDTDYELNVDNNGDCVCDDCYECYEDEEDDDEEDECLWD